MVETIGGACGLLWAQHELSAGCKLSLTGVSGHYLEKSQIIHYTNQTWMKTASLTASRAAFPQVLLIILPLSSGLCLQYKTSSYIRKASYNFSTEEEFLTEQVNNVHIKAKAILLPNIITTFDALIFLHHWTISFFQALALFYIIKSLKFSCIWSWRQSWDSALDGDVKTWQQETRNWTTAPTGDPSSHQSSFCPWN